MVVLAGDVGGTKTLLRCVAGDGATLHEQRFENRAYESFDALMREFLEQFAAETNAPIDSACIGVAGPVDDRRVTVTHLGWTMDEASLSRTFSIPRVTLVNDFYAVAAAVPLLDKRDLVSLQAGRRHPGAPVAIIGAGTGLGEALIVGGRILSTEAGHAAFAPLDEEQARLFLALHARLGYVNWEDVVSGPGLVNIFTFLGGAECDPREISELAGRGDGRARRTFELFIDAYGGEAGNLALRSLARGGVYVAGGIAAKNVERFTDGRFLAAFARKGKFAQRMAAIPIDLVINEEAGLLGALAIARGNQ